MGGSLAKCLAPGQPHAPPVVFTVCSDGMPHEFDGKDFIEAGGVGFTTLSCCKKCGKTKTHCDLQSYQCQHHNHEWCDSCAVGVPVGVPVQGCPTGLATAQTKLSKAFDATHPVREGQEKQPTTLPKDFKLSPAAVYRLRAELDGVAMGEQKCKHCGMRRRLDARGITQFDDFYMHGARVCGVHVPVAAECRSFGSQLAAHPPMLCTGGGFMMGMEAGQTFGIMGAAEAAFADPMYLHSPCWADMDWSPRASGAFSDLSASTPS